MIRVLPQRVVNQIAAGEVIERPFSVVKELVENSLNAGAGSVQVELVDGGLVSVRVIDDGLGFGEEDLALAFASHATSKLSEVGDLDHIASLGFRGEALASIGSVSRASIQCRQPGQEAGHEVRCTGGQLAPVAPCGCPVGTVVEVRDLFHNTPARRKFLRSPQAERARIQDLLVRLALPRLDVDFTLVVDGHRVLRLPKGESLQGRVRRAFGQDATADLIPVQRQQGNLRIEGLVSEPDAARKTSTMELLYVNGRLARERGTTHAVRQAYRAFVMPGRFPVYFLMLSMPADQVDVNVHPSKAEVRFGEGRRVAGLLYDGVRMALLSRGFESGAGGVQVGQDLPRARSGFPDLPADLFARTGEDAPQAADEVRERVDGGAGMAAGTGAGSGTARPSPSGRPHPFKEVKGPFLQIMDLYILLEGPGGLLVVDQHALHERVIYERLVERDRRRKVKIQKLLVPEVVEMDAEDKAWLLEHAPVLAAEGFLLEDFGGQAVAIQGMPAALGNANPVRVAEALLKAEGEDDNRPVGRELVAERFHSMACRAAVMSGDKLGRSEIEALLEEAARLKHPHNCPHGRPTVLTFTTGELERYFRRRL